ncbi:MAG: hypothetical protein WCQ95_09720 [Bacteroidota bacterium]
MNPFSEKYKLSRTSDLLKIIECPDEYQPLAVEAAKFEIADRQLTDIELNEAKTELEFQRQENKIRIDKKREIENNVRRNIFNFLNTFNLIQKSTPTSDKLIKLISIVFGAISVYKIYNEFNFITSLFTYNSGHWDLWTVLYILPLIFLPIAIVLFWRRKKIGWILLVVFLTYSIINLIALIYVIINSKSSGSPIIDSIFPRPSFIEPILVLIFFGGALLTICKKNVREKYGIDNRHLIASIGITTVLTGFIIFLYN